jgi:hypothetical protein
MVYRGARKGRGLVVSPKDYSTKYRYWRQPNLNLDEGMLDFVHLHRPFQ